METIQEVNELNRRVMAEEMIPFCLEMLSIREKYERKEIIFNDLVDDIAAYIDLKLPSAWIRRNAFQATGERLSYGGIEKIPGAIFQNTDNYRVDQFIVQATSTKRQPFEQEPTTDNNEREETQK
ncbi:MAG: hypothetical protein Q8T08_05325 [Ignavibacteria bacterium]|nr:hypothetical protein [Ignavibacteria bacterium]